jgi:hypothetical protein
MRRMIGGDVFEKQEPINKSQDARDGKQAARIKDLTKEQTKNQETEDIEESLRKKVVGNELRSLSQRPLAKNQPIIKKPLNTTSIALIFDFHQNTVKKND